MIKYMGIMKKTDSTSKAHRWVVASEQNPIRRYPVGPERIGKILKRIASRCETPMLWKLVD
jgi:hypothetical protein